MYYFSHLVLSSTHLSFCLLPTRDVHVAMQWSVIKLYITYQYHDKVKHALFLNMMFFNCFQETTLSFFSPHTFFISFCISCFFSLSLLISSSSPCPPNVEVLLNLVFTPFAYLYLTALVISSNLKACKYLLLIGVLSSGFIYPAASASLFGCLIVNLDLSCSKFSPNFLLHSNLFSVIFISSNEITV